MTLSARHLFNSKMRIHFRNRLQTLLYIKRKPKLNKKKRRRKIAKTLSVFSLGSVWFGGFGGEVIF
jgi:hypothetical protein